MVLAIFVVLSVIGQALNIALCLALDKIFSPAIGALAFVLLYMVVFAIAWIIALKIAESRQRKQVPQEAPRDTEPRLATHAG